MARQRPIRLLGLVRASGVEGPAVRERAVRRQTIAIWAGRSTGAFMGPPASPTWLAEVDGRAWIDAEQRGSGAFGRLTRGWRNDQ